jgi:hypothetical protein
LRAGLDAFGPRVIIFETSGYIDMNSYIAITSPCLTVAGQTAPSPGITIRATNGFDGDKTILIQTHDVLFQHFAIRPGGDSCNSAVQLYNGDIYNVVFDHMSVSWGQDENIGIQGPARDVTFWRTITSEGIFQVSGSAVCSGGGVSNGHSLLIGGSGNGGVAVIQSLLSRSRERTPLIGDSSAVYFANNVISAGHEGFGVENGPVLTSVINNYIKRRGGTGGETPNAFLVHGVSGSTQMYLSGNTIDDGGLSPAQNTFNYFSGSDPRVGSAPITAPSGYTPMSAAAAYTSVLANVGARPAYRDAVDTRILGDVTNRSSNGNISHQNDVGGYPTLAVVRQALLMPANANQLTSSGYTNLEIWLQSLASAVEKDGAAEVPQTPFNLSIKSQ